MRLRWISWSNVALVIVVIFFAYRVALIRHVRGPQNGKAPSLTMQTIDGQRVSLQDLRGKAVLLNFWATWCGPCRLEVPWLQRIADKHGREGLVVVGVLQDDASDAAVRSFMSAHHAGYAVVRDSGPIADRMGGITSLPTTFYIGRDGTIAHAVGGLIPEFLMNIYVEDSLRARP